MKTIPALIAAALALVPAGPAGAALITSASTVAPTIDVATATMITAQSAPPANAGYAISLAGAPAGQGTVRGKAANQYAIPVAGASANLPTYLTGDYGSAQTTSAASAGSYFSTGGPGQIVFDGSRGQFGLILLWGSIDAWNSLEFQRDGVSIGTIGGRDVQDAASWLISSGDQGAAGSAYVTIASSLEFNRVIARSTNPSFEFAAVVSTRAADVPEPPALALFGGALAGLGAARARRPARSSRPARLDPYRPDCGQGDTGLVFSGLAIALTVSSQGDCRLSGHSWLMPRMPAQRSVGNKCGSTPTKLPGKIEA